MSESFAGITVPPGEPGALEGMASAWIGMGGALEAAAGRLRSMQAGLGSWQGPASVAFAGASFTASDGVSVNGQAFGYAAGATKRYAHALRDAKHDARAAIRDARDATDRIDRATEQLNDARGRAGAAAAAETFAATQVLATSLVGTPDPGAQADQARAQQAREQAEADAARAQRALDAAQDDLEAAQRRGHDAEDAARTAATEFAGALSALGAAPPPPPPPAAPPPPKEEHHGLLGSIVHGIGDAAGEVKDFTVDTAKGVGDFAVGMKDVAVMGWHLSPVYGVIDPEGQQREYEMLGQGAKFAWEHPGEFAKAMVDWDDIANGHPGRAFGQMLPNIVLTVATAGGGAAAKGATTVNAVSKMSKATKVADDVADAGKASKVVEGAASHADDLPPVTYRGDARSPEEIFETGFQPRGTSTDLEHYALTNDPSAFVGTSKSSEVAAEFAGPGGYHYVIRAPDGIDVNATLGSRSPFPYEQEVVFQGGINTEHVVGAHPVGTNLELGDFVHNPHHPAR